MNVLTTSLFLLAVLMMQVKADPDLTQDLGLPALGESLLLFDVMSEADAADVKAALSGMDIHHSYKVIGVPRYFFVIVDSDDLATLRQIRFPAGSTVTQVPVEHASDYFDMFDVSGWEDTHVDLAVGDGVVNLFVWTVRVPENATAYNYERLWTHYTQLFQQPHNQVAESPYVSASRFPVTMYLFNNIPANDFQNMMEDSIDTVGFGFGKMTVTHFRLASI